MKCLAAIAVVAALLALPACAQRGGSHGGVSRAPARGGFLGPRGGTSVGRGSFSTPGAPSFHGPSVRPPSGSFGRSGTQRFGGVPNGSRGFSPRPPSIRPPARLGGIHSAPGQFAAPPQPVSHRMLYPGHGLIPRAPSPVGPRQFGPGSHRMPYHSPNGGDHRDRGWDHRSGGDHRDGGWDHRGHHRDHDHFRFYGFYGYTGYPLWPGLGWGYPYLPNYWGD